MRNPLADERQKSLGEQAFDRLKEDIVWCRLMPGEEVSEARLAALTGFGKAPIREALFRLAQEGYVIAIPRRGHMIAPVTLQMVKDIFELRLLLEPAAVEKACGRVERADLLRLDAICAKGYRPGDEVSEARFMAANKAFHMAVAWASGNARLARSLSQIIDEMARLLHLGFVLRERPEGLRGEHSALIDALVKGDCEGARAITVTHVESVRGLVLEGISAHTGLYETELRRTPAAAG